MVFIFVAPFVVWEIFSAAAAYYAAREGLKLMLQTEETPQAKFSDSQGTEWEITEARDLGNALADDDEFILMKEDVKLTFRKTAKGRVKICVSGAKKSKAALRAIGEKVVNQLMQQYAYKQTLDTVKKRGFQVVDEQTLEDGSIRVHVQRWV